MVDKGIARLYGWGEAILRRQCLFIGGYEKVREFFVDKQGVTMPVYSVTVSTSVSAKGLGAWYARMFNGLLNNQKDGPKKNAFDIDVRAEDCDKLEESLASDRRVNDFQVKEE